MVKKSKVIDPSEVITSDNISQRLNVDNIIRHNKTKAVLRRRKIVSVLIIFVLIALLLTGGAYGILQFIEQNSMRILINQNDKIGLALSATSSFENPVVRLSMTGERTEMTNITYYNLDFENAILGMNGVYLEGGPRGNNYVAYTFFVKNVSPYNTVEYNESLVITRTKENADAAIRVMVIYNRSETTIYAKSNNGEAEYAFYDSDKREIQRPINLESLDFPEEINYNDTLTTSFIEPTELDRRYIVRQTEKVALAIDEYDTYTVVVWYEGSDAECTDDINKGFVTLEYMFEIAETGESVYN